MRIRAPQVQRFFPRALVIDIRSLPKIPWPASGRWAMLPRILRYPTVQVSEMVRDPSYFHAIREKCGASSENYPSLKVWIAGYSDGKLAACYRLPDQSSRGRQAYPNRPDVLWLRGFFWPISNPLFQVVGLC
jgi:hypothetical protein